MAGASPERLKFKIDPAARGAHTHHITLVNAAVTQTTAGFEVTGSANDMANRTIAAISRPF